MSNEINNLYAFADFRFDSERLKLWHNGDIILLSPKASELLALLVRHEGRFVSKEEIFETVWKDTFVEDGVLTQNIYTLRKALGTNDGQPMIENRTRLGYRLTVPVHKAIQTNGDLSIETLPLEDATELSTNGEITRTPRRMLRLAIAGAVALILLPTAFFGWRYLRPSINAFFRPPIESVKFTKLTNSGDLVSAVLSPDGNIIAFIRGDGVYLKDINTDKEIKLDIPNVKSFSALQFSPDGESLYFRNSRILSTQAAIMRVSRLGGEAEQVIDRSWGTFSVSPDSSRIAYILSVPPVAKFNLKVRDLASAQEKEFFAAEQPHSPCLVCTPAWSPDGSKIIFATNIPTATGQLFIVDLKTDKKDEIKFEKLRRFEQAAWLPDGRSFIVSATEGSRFFHLWKVYYPDGEVQPLTNGLSSYTKVSVSSDGNRVLALRADETANVFIAETANLNQVKQITTGPQNSFGQNGLHWIDEKRILYSTQTEQNLADNLAIVNTDDGSRTPVTNERQSSFRVPVSDGKTIWFTMNKDGAAQIFQMALNGKDVKQLTSGTDGQRQSPRVTSDARYLYYVRRGKDGGSIMRFDLQNQKEETFFTNPEYQPGPFLELSPDNKYLTFFRMQDRPTNADEDFNAVMTVLSVENTDDIKTFPVSAVPPIRRFSPDSLFVDYIYAVTDATQIVRQSIEGGEVRPVFTTTEGKIFNFAWSKNGKQLALSLGRQNKDAVLLTDLH